MPQLLHHSHKIKNFQTDGCPDKRTFTGYFSCSGNLHELYNDLKYPTRYWKYLTILTEWIKFTVIYCSQYSTSDLSFARTCPLFYCYGMNSIVFFCFLFCLHLDVPLSHFGSADRWMDKDKSKCLPLRGWGHKNAVKYRQHLLQEQHLLIWYNLVGFKYLFKILLLWLHIYIHRPTVKPVLKATSE